MSSRKLFSKSPLDTFSFPPFKRESASRLEHSNGPVETGGNLRRRSCSYDGAAFDKTLRAEEPATRIMDTRAETRQGKRQTACLPSVSPPAFRVDSARPLAL